MKQQSIKTAWDEAGHERWTAEDQKRFDRAFKSWAKRTGNQTCYELRVERGGKPFGFRSGARPDGES